MTKLEKVATMHSCNFIGGMLFVSLQEQNIAHPDTVRNKKYLDF